MAISGIRVECLRLAQPPQNWRSPIYVSPPIWVEDILLAGTTALSVPESSWGFVPASSYVFRVTAREDAYVLVGKNLSAVTTANGLIVLTGTQMLIQAVPGDVLSWVGEA